MAVIQFALTTMVLALGLAAVYAITYRASVYRNWDTMRCDPYVIPTAGFFKPANDPRSAAQFARDNWSFCQGGYIRSALKEATAAAGIAVSAEQGVAGLAQEALSAVADVFFGIWSLFHEAYSAFMDRMTTVAKLFHNQLISLHGIVDRLQASVLSIVMALMSLVVTFINTVQFTLMVVIIVIGILLALEIILFFLLLPISSLIITYSAVAAVVVVAVATSIAAVEVCFSPTAPVVYPGGKTRPIAEVRVGDILGDGGRVTAVHQFRSSTQTWYDLNGIYVTGDHLVTHPDRPKELVPVRECPGAVRCASQGSELWCLTTTTRRIPVHGSAGVVMFADWEEIPSEDTETQRAWHDAVWAWLNGGGIPPYIPPSHVLASEAAISPDCRVERVRLWGVETVRACDLQVGDWLLTREGWMTTVTGVVDLAGDQVERVIELPTAGGAQRVSCAVWLSKDGEWRHPRGFAVSPVAPERWVHIYTSNGTLDLVGGWRIRDASDVGLEHVGELVNRIVL